MKAILKFALLSFFFLFETNLIIASNSPDLFEPQPNRRSINRPTSSLQTPRVHAAQSRCELALQTEEFYAATLLDSNNSNLQAPASTPRAMNRSESYAQIIQQQEQATQSYKSEFKQSYESQEDSTAKIYTATSFLPEQLNSPKQSPKRLDHQGSREK